MSFVSLSGEDMVSVHRTQHYLCSFISQNLESVHEYGNEQGRICLYILFKFVTRLFYHNVGLNGSMLR